MVWSSRIQTISSSAAPVAPGKDWEEGKWQQCCHLIGWRGSGGSLLIGSQLHLAACFSLRYLWRHQVQLAGSSVDHWVVLLLPCAGRWWPLSGTGTVLRDHWSRPGRWDTGTPEEEPRAWGSDTTCSERINVFEGVIWCYSQSYKQLQPSGQGACTWIRCSRSFLQFRCGSSSGSDISRSNTTAPSGWNTQQMRWEWQRENVGHLFCRAHSSIQSFQSFISCSWWKVDRRLYFGGINLGPCDLMMTPQTPAVEDHWTKRFNVTLCIPKLATNYILLYCIILYYIVHNTLVCTWHFFNLFIFNFGLCKTWLATFFFDTFFLPCCMLGFTAYNMMWQIKSLIFLIFVSSDSHSLTLVLGSAAGSVQITHGRQVTLVAGLLNGTQEAIDLFKVHRARDLCWGVVGVIRGGVGSTYETTRPVNCCCCSTGSWSSSTGSWSSSRGRWSSSRSSSGGGNVFLLECSIIMALRRCSSSSSSRGGNDWSQKSLLRQEDFSFWNCGNWKQQKKKIMASLPSKTQRKLSHSNFSTLDHWLCQRIDLNILWKMLPTVFSDFQVFLLISEAAEGLTCDQWSVVPLNGALPLTDEQGIGMGGSVAPRWLSEGLRPGSQLVRVRGSIEETMSIWRHTGTETQGVFKWPEILVEAADKRWFHLTVFCCSCCLLKKIDLSVSFNDCHDCIVYFFVKFFFFSATAVAVGIIKVHLFYEKIPYCWY